MIIIIIIFLITKLINNYIYKADVVQKKLQYFPL